jgi:hypothetical protein
VIPVAPPPSEHRPDIAVDGFDFPEGTLLVTIVQDAGQMSHQQGAELLGRRQALPAESKQPIGQEAVGRRLVRVRPELGVVP